MNCGGVLKSTEPGSSGERGAGAGLINRGESGCEEAWSTHLKGTLENILDEINHSNLSHKSDV